ncbi:MAG: hypothetical protein OEV45_13660 [Desulfobacteraceae bacterium]|nr:hypothetical protein [Desulfobacteraceae bacterium]
MKKYLDIGSVNDIYIQNIRKELKEINVLLRQNKQFQPLSIFVDRDLGIYQTDVFWT